MPGPVDNDGMSPTVENTGRGFWERYGWVPMTSIWLVFLVFPLIAVWTEDPTPFQRTAGTALVVAFAVIYVRAFVIAFGLPEEASTARIGTTHLLALVACTLGLTGLVAADGLGTLPFLVALSVFTLPTRWTVAITLTCLALPVALPALGVVSHGLEFMSLIVALVAASTGLVRVMEKHESEKARVDRELEITSERDRVARDVHDVLGHTLTVVATKSELAGRLIDVDPERARAEIAQVHALSREALTEIRAVVAGLRVTRLPDELDGARTALAAAGVDLEVTGGPDDLDPRHRLVAAWVLREAVTNVVRHSGAGRCTVELTERRLVVSDDGTGMGGRPDGNGLRGLRERVADSGGTVEVGSARDDAPHGTTLEVAW
jgi:two-component system sensor histidine kinase DesK